MNDPSQPISQTNTTIHIERGVVIKEIGKPPYGSQKDSSYTGGYKILY